MLPQFQTIIPDSILLGIIVVSALLAVATMVLMFVRMQSSPAGEEGRRPPFDPVLLGSAIAVLVLAAVAYLTR
ncbi:MAG TPA: hypothetical protein VHG52_00265 [Thermomicrobiales bacterium]|nr:hypothetical protein [Thermomicrobiales bacterium]